MKKAIMNTMIILFALAMCVGCGQSSEQKEESVPTDVTKAEKQEQVQVEAEDEDTLENGEQVFRVVEVMPKFPGGDAELLKFIAKNVKYPQMMPRWTPGTQRGEPVAVKYTVPITFKLQ